jgi:streptomycin 6-kinase
LRQAEHVGGGHWRVGAWTRKSAWNANADAQRGIGGRWHNSFMTEYPDLPRLDEARPRLVRRFGDGVQSWLEELPGCLLALKKRWSLELESVIPKGSMSVVIRCRTAQRQHAVLKISPDRERVAREIAGLAHWSTTHVPTVLQADPRMGALLMEEIEPGIPLQDSGTYPALGDVAQLLSALHAQGTPDFAFPSVRDRVAYLFAAWARERQSDPAQVALVPHELFERGRRLALRLAEEPSPTVLLHGDFTPVNILDGGARRGLVAIDPCPTLGDPAFDAIDLLFWQAGDLDTICRRAELLAPAIGGDATRLLDWCTAFAGMAAADLEGTGQRAEPPGDKRSERVKAAISLAARAPPPEKVDASRCDG